MSFEQVAKDKYLCELVQLGVTEKVDTKVYLHMIMKNQNHIKKLGITMTLSNGLNGSQQSPMNLAIWMSEWFGLS